MFIIGEMNVTYKKAVGEFYCPRCAETRPYRQRRVRRFLTVYFIPLIPLDLISEHLQCQHCRQIFPMDSKERKGDDYRREAARLYANDVRHVMVLTMMADGVAEEAEIATIQQVYRQLTEEDISRVEIDREIAQVRLTGVTAANYARAIAFRRSPEEKRWLLRGAFLVASAAGEISEKRLEQLKSLPQALGVPEEQFRQIVSEVT